MRKTFAIRKSAERGKKKAGASVRRRRRTGVASLEDQLVKLALAGELGKGTAEAVREIVKKGLPLTFKRGTKIVKLYADGREEILGEIATPSYRLPRGVGIIGS